MTLFKFKANLIFILDKTEKMSIDSEFEAFGLRSSIECHAMDITSVCSLPNGGFITESTDNTSKCSVHKFGIFRNYGSQLR